LNKLFPLPSLASQAGKELSDDLRNTRSIGVQVALPARVAEYKIPQLSADCQVQPNLLEFTSHEKGRVHFKKKVVMVQETARKQATSPKVLHQHNVGFGEFILHVHNGLTIIGYAQAPAWFSL